MRERLNAVQDGEGLEGETGISITDWLNGGRNTNVTNGTGGGGLKLLFQ